MFSYGTLRYGAPQKKLIYTIIAAVWAFVTCVSATDSFSYQEGGENKREWSPVSAGPVTTWTAPLCGASHLALQPFLFYNRTRGAFDGEGRYDPLPNGDEKSQWQEQLFAQFGLTEDLEIDAQAVYQENFRRQDGTSARADGFGDSYLFARYCVVEEHNWLPHVSGLFQVKFPTGKYQKGDPDKLGTDLMGAGSGGGSYDHGYGVNVTKRLRPFVFHGDAVWCFPTEATIDGVKTKHGDYQNYDVGIEYFLPKGFNLMVECNACVQEDRREDGSLVPASGTSFLAVASGVGWSCDAIQMLVAYQRTLLGKNTDANDSVAFTFVYTF